MIVILMNLQAVEMRNLIIMFQNLLSLTHLSHQILLIEKKLNIKMIKNNKVILNRSIMENL